MDQAEVYQVEKFNALSFMHTVNLNEVLRLKGNEIVDRRVYGLLSFIEDQVFTSGFSEEVCGSIIADNIAFDLLSGIIRRIKYGIDGGIYTWLISSRISKYGYPSYGQVGVDIGKIFLRVKNPELIVANGSRFVAILSDTDLLGNSGSVFVWVWNLSMFN